MEKDQKSINLFEGIAEAIAEKHRANVKILTIKFGGRPPFDELMTELKMMEQELTKQGVQFIEEYKATQHKVDDKMTGQLKDIIRNTIEAFIKGL